MESSYFLNRYEKMSKKHVTQVTLKKCLRVNTLKSKNADIEDFFKQKRMPFEKIPFLKNGYYIDDESFNIVSTKEYLDGYFYIQEAASQVPVEVLEPNGSELVLDMCASPGSKSTQISAHMDNKGVLICLESNKRRIDRLLNNFERCKVKNAIVINSDARFFEFEKKFDKILLDAPCSGNFASDKEWFEKKENYVIEEISEISNLQKELISAAHKLLKKGGLMVYSTCSLEPEENEMIIDYAIKKIGFAVEKIEKDIGSEGLTSFENHIFDDSLKLTKRFWPNKDKTQGFFIAKLRKT